MSLNNVGGNEFSKPVEPTTKESKTTEAKKAKEAKPNSIFTNTNDVALWKLEIKYIDGARTERWIEHS